MPKAVIVGGGIGGLTAALTFHHFGWQVEVLERSQELGQPRVGRSVDFDSREVHVHRPWNWLRAEGDCRGLLVHAFQVVTHFVKITLSFFLRCFRLKTPFPPSHATYAQIRFPCFESLETYSRESERVQRGRENGALSFW